MGVFPNGHPVPGPQSKNHYLGDKQTVNLGSPSLFVSNLKKTVSWRRSLIPSTAVASLALWIRQTQRGMKQERESGKAWDRTALLGPHCNRMWAGALGSVPAHRANHQTACHTEAGMKKKQRVSWAQQSLAWRSRLARPHLHSCPSGPERFFNIFFQMIPTFLFTLTRAVF